MEEIRTEDLAGQDFMLVDNVGRTFVLENSMVTIDNAIISEENETIEGQVEIFSCRLGAKLHIFIHQDNERKSFETQTEVVSIHSLPLPDICQEL